MPTFHQRCKRRQHRHNQAIPQKKNKRETKIMVSRRSFLAASAAGGVMAASSNTLGQVGMTSSVKTGYAPVNGRCRHDTPGGGSCEKTSSRHHDFGLPFVFFLRDGLIMPVLSSFASLVESRHFQRSGEFPSGRSPAKGNAWPIRALLRSSSRG